MTLKPIQWFVDLVGGIAVTIDDVEPYSPKPSYAVRWGCRCLSKQGEWEPEPIPSSRTSMFLTRCRWSDLEGATTAALSAVAQMEADRE